ncbi:uncharacterized protein ISCGN_029400 [Ixodes scapularis]
MYKIYIKITLMCFPATVLLTYGNSPECDSFKHCTKHDRHAVCSEGSCICVNGTHKDITSKVFKCNPGRRLNQTCSLTSECSRLDIRSRCDGGICRCKPGSHEAPTPMGLKCFSGTTAKPQCNAERPCSSQAFFCTPWGICDCRLPGYKAELLFSRWQCIRDPFLFEDRGTITFLKVSPVPLLVIVIILAYFGYQRKAKSPPIHRSVHEVSRLQQRRIVPLWRGVTFHPSTITQGSPETIVLTIGYWRCIFWVSAGDITCAMHDGRVVGVLHQQAPLVARHVIHVQQKEGRSQYRALWDCWQDG